jgi:hypothetical protein
MRFHSGVVSEAQAVMTSIFERLRLAGGVSEIVRYLWNVNGFAWVCGALLASVSVIAACSNEEPSGPMLSAAGQSGAAAGGNASAGQGTAGAAVLAGSAGSAGAAPAGGSTSGSSAGGAAAGGGAGGSAAGASTTFLLPAYTGSAAKPSSNMGTRNAGHQFEVQGEPLVIRDLGIWDSAADGLAAAHTVTLFALDRSGADAAATPIAGGSVTVPAGTAAPLEAGFRFAALPAPLTLAAGSYAVVAYGLNAADLPGDGGGLPLPATGVRDARFDPYQFVVAVSPAFPSGGDQNSHANASFRFESNLKPLRIMPLGASITNGFLGTQAGYRGPLKQLLDAADITFQFVGSWTDNPGAIPLPREQQHHEGHPGYVIHAGTSGRSGIHDFRHAWLGATGSQADLFLIVIGTNDVDLNYELDTAAERLDALVAGIWELQPNAHIVLAQLPPIDDDAEDLRCVEYNEAVVATVEAYQLKGAAISTVDLHSAVARSDLGDKLHPSDAGYTKMAQAFFDEIQSLGW